MKVNKQQFKGRARSYMKRSVDVVNIRQRFLIVCEGAKTEPQYFKEFRASGLVVKIEGIGMNTLRLVKETMKLRVEDEYDQVWCVFDKDDFPIDQFENAIQLADENGIGVAYSNQAFELWYVLHFEYLHSAIDRKAYMKVLDKHLNEKYEKNDPRIYQLLRCRMNTAIRYAQKLLEEYPCPHPGRDDPSTTVHKLVIALLEHSRPPLQKSFVEL